MTDINPLDRDSMIYTVRNLTTAPVYVPKYAPAKVIRDGGGEYVECQLVSGHSVLLPRADIECYATSKVAEVFTILQHTWNLVEQVRTR